jgi:DNA-binding MarR family transcriptional regulator
VSADTTEPGLAGVPTERGDDVEAIVSAWRRERPDLDVTPLEVLSRVTRLARHLDRARSTAFTAHDLEVWEFDVLAALRRAGEPYQLSAGSLGAQTLVTSGTMTNRIDRLEARRFVQRLPDPRDGRAVMVRLTPAGRERVDTALADLLDRERAILATLTSPDQVALAGLLRRVLTPFERG